MLISSQEICHKAIAYYRHSAEDKQENSVAIQRQYVEKFAMQHNIEIIHDETDEGKSGLLANRPAFARIFNNWIQNSEAPEFNYILVYDVSRWGRFQNQDEAGYFTHICTKHNKKVIYVSIGFPNETNQLFSSLGISLHRYMAAEYSRQLSEKVFYGSIKVSQQGYSAGGTAVYGMARELLDVNKKHIRILEKGEHKQIANERVSFIPKNDETTEIVIKIFDLFVKEKYQLLEIATYLNGKGFVSANGKLWDKTKIVKILSNEIYIGTLIYNKKWGRLKQKSCQNPRSEWVIVPKAFRATIDEYTFKKAQERLYWIFSNSRRNGVNAIKHVKRNIQNDIFKWLVDKGITDFDAEEIIWLLPIIYSIKIENDGVPNWCFLISEKIRRFDNVLAISVAFKPKSVIDGFFLFSVKDFTLTNFLILSKNSKFYNNTKIVSDDIEKIVKLLINQIKNSKKRFNKKYQLIE